MSRVTGPVSVWEGGLPRVRGGSSSVPLTNTSGPPPSREPCHGGGPPAWGDGVGPQDTWGPGVRGLRRFLCRGGKDNLLVTGGPFLLRCRRGPLPGVPLLPCHGWSRVPRSFSTQGPRGGVDPTMFFSFKFSLSDLRLKSYSWAVRGAWGDSFVGSDGRSFLPSALGF